MATRRRGGANLDDLKARLGMQDEPSSTSEAPQAAPSETTAPSDASGETSEPSAEAAAPASAPAADSSPSDAPRSEAPAAPAPARPAAPAPRPAPAAPSGPSAADLEDFASAVHDEAAPPASPPPEADLDIDVTPRSEVPMMAVLGAIGILLVGAFLGLMAGTGNNGRNIANARLDGAGELHAAIEPVAVQIATLNGQLQGIDADTRYNPDFEARLREVWEGGRPEVRTTALTSASTSIVLAVDPELTRRVIEYVNATQQLSLLVEDHLRRTERDQEEIQRELANIQDERAIGIVFSFEGTVNAFNALFEDPEAQWSPVIGERVFLESMEPVRIGDPPAEGEEDARPLGYNAQRDNGQALQVPVTDLVFLPRAQLLPAVSSETAISRYRARTTAIKNAVEAIAQQQGAITDQLQELAAEPRVFAF